MRRRHKVGRGVIFGFRRWSPCFGPGTGNKRTNAHSLLCSRCAMSISPPMVFTLTALLLVVHLVGAQSGCQYLDGNYRLQWFVDNARNVHFQLSFANFPVGANAWTGVAFGTSMHAGLDVIVVRVMGDRISVRDEFVRGFRDSWPDASQDVRVLYSSLKDGLLVVRFMRPLTTADSMNDRPLNGCQPWKFPSSISFLGYDGSMQKHILTPTSITVCVEQCRQRL